jgi:peptidoglycan/LPS O-acetylase OafA/YrhL
VKKLFHDYLFPVKQEHCLANLVTNKDNNFNLIRFFAATLVLFSHCYPLSGQNNGVDPLSSLTGSSLGGLAVDIFFVCSGFLITSSYLNRNNIKLFFIARIRRIYPALITAVFFCCFIVGPILTTHGTVDYLTDKQTFKFFLENSTLLGGIEYDLPGLFTENPYPNVVNGSLWTLPVEFKMYILIGITLFISLEIEKRKNLIIAKYIIPAIVLYSLSTLAAKELNILNSSQSKLTVLFFAGSSLYLWRDKVVINKWTTFISTSITASLIFIDDSKISYIMLLPYTVISIAYVTRKGIFNFNKLGDYSYGIYIYSFPIQQIIISTDTPSSAAHFFTHSLFLSLIIAIISWHLIEKHPKKGREVERTN